ncbi:MAG: hypothetical protein EBV23_14585 [Flavobacteriia bacterium]|nr:hypothetical protein [Flavobacteriia bacterium]
MGFTLTIQQFNYWVVWWGAYQKKENIEQLKRSCFLRASMAGENPTSIWIFLDKTLKKPFPVFWRGFGLGFLVHTGLKRCIFRQ